MKLSEILKILYSEDLNKIIEIINSSILSKDFPFEKEKSFIIDTGFIFEMQDGEPIELFYDFVNNTLVRQPKFNNNPKILGLTHLFGDDWIEIWDHKIISIVDERIDSTIINSFENVSDVFNYNLFQIISSDSSELIVSPLNKKLYETLCFYDGCFNLYNKDDDDVYDDDDDDCDDVDDDHDSFGTTRVYDGSSYWSCDACDGSSYTGCLSSTGTCYRH